MKILFNFRYLSRKVLRDNLYTNYVVSEISRNEKNSKLNLYCDKYINNTISYAKKNILAYRNFKNLKCIEDFPIIDRQDLLHSKCYYPSGIKQYFGVKGKTSGTTGTPLEIVRSYMSIIWEQAFIKRHWSWSGFKDGMRRATLRGDDVVPLSQSDPPFWFYNRYDNQLLISSRHLKLTNLSSIINRLNDFSPFILQAYPSTAFLIADFLDKNDIKLSIPFVYTGSEILYPYQRELIEKRIGKVMDFYGMAERVAFASECEFGNLHVNTDYSYVEIVDDNGCKTNDYGYVVGTTFHNMLMPLIRYKLSDRTRWKEGVCPCGRVYPMIEPIQGKFEDLIYDSECNPVSPSLVTFAFKGVKNIECSQVAQVAKGKWEIRILPSSNFTLSDGNKVLQNIRENIDKNLILSLKIVDSIERTKSAKYRWILNEM
jgi:phenylacetate-CoA ligase